jgi:hypothetical protein
LKGWWIIERPNTDLIELKPVAEVPRSAPAKPQAGVSDADLNAIDYLERLDGVDRPVPFRALPKIAPEESSAVRWMWLVTATVVTILFAKMVLTFWAPAHGGVDQNGYLVGGRQFAYSLSTRFVPQTDYEYVGNMWVLTGFDKDHKAVYYPKYPLGLPILYAIPFWIGGEKFASVYAFYVSPFGAIAAIAGMFFLGRQIAGSFAGVLGMILLGASQCVLVLMNNANSHASCLAFVVWGMYLLARWWQTNSIWRGILAGFLLGFACLIRYTEGLLVLPIALACITCMRWTDRRSYLRNVVPLLAWLLPVAYLLIFNKRAMGTWTGYDSTNESEFGAAFTWKKFVLTWEQMLRTFHDMGLFFVLPLGMAGMALLFKHSWKLGLWAILWLLPGTLLYTSYYWSPDRGVAYARFFVTFFPVLLIGFGVLAKFGFAQGTPGRRAIVAPIAAGIVVAISAGVGTYRSTQGMEDGRATPNQSLVGLHRGQASLAVSGAAMVNANIPGGSVVFTEERAMGEGMLNYTQFLGRWEIYSTQAFSASARRAFIARREPDPNDPNPLQPARREYLAKVYEGKNQQQMLEEQNKILRERAKAGKKIFAVTSGQTYALALDIAERTFPRENYSIKTITRWHDQTDPPTMTWSAALNEYFLHRKPNPATDFVDTAAAPQPDPRFAGGRRGNFGGGPGGPGGPGRGPDQRPMALVLVEVTPK